MGKWLCKCITVLAHLGCPYFFLHIRAVTLRLGSGTDHFLCLSPAAVLRMRMAGRIWELVDSTEYSKLVIILILLHLTACSSLVGWQLLSLDRAEKKLAQWRSNGSCCVNRTNRATRLPPKSAPHMSTKYAHVLLHVVSP